MRQKTQEVKRKTGKAEPLLRFIAFIKWIFTSKLWCAVNTKTGAFVEIGNYEWCRRYVSYHKTGLYKVKPYFEHLLNT